MTNIQKCGNVFSITLNYADSDTQEAEPHNLLEFAPYGLVALHLRLMFLLTVVPSLSIVMQL